ncbi:hypothetical protein HYV43_00500 [Candidatus Micrarchaeota archaeon]|nr:hypothetical protein [Candidatus Micrarchaeota archaeon]
MQQMGSACCKMSGLMLLISGLSFLTYGLNIWKDGMLVHLVGGLFLTLYALGSMMHAMDMCPSCQVMPESKAPAKKK